MGRAALGRRVSALLNELVELSHRIEHDPARGFVLRLEKGALPLFRTRAQAEMLLGPHLHAKLFARGPGAASARVMASGDLAFVGRLRATAAGVSTWDEGWRVVKASSEWAFVVNDQVCLFVDDRDDLMPPDAQVGETAAVRLPCARENRWPGYFGWASRAGLPKPGTEVQEAYLNLSPEHAPALVRELLALSKVRYEARLLNDPAAYARVDTARVASAQMDVVLEALKGFTRTWPRAVRPGCPLLLEAVAEGIGLSAPQVVEPDGRLIPYGHLTSMRWAHALLDAVEHATLVDEAWLAETWARLMPKRQAG